MGYPRKLKKKILGKKLSKTKLKFKLNNIILSDDGYPLNCIPFCPKCGCEKTRFIDHGVAYPERWCEERCLRCDTIVVYSDNSPFLYALSYKDNNYEIPI